MCRSPNLIRAVCIAGVLIVCFVLATPAYAQIQPFTYWDFNSTSLNTLPNLLPTLKPDGSNPTLRLLHSGSSSFPIDSNFDTGDGADLNRVWRTTGYPAQGTGSGTAGFQVDRLNTVGERDLLMTVSIGANNLLMANTGISRWYQAQVSTNGGASFADYGAPIELRPRGGLDSAYFTNVFVNLSGLSAVNNSTDVRVRLVSVFAPGTANYQGLVGNYNAAASVNYDMVAFAASNRFSTNPGSTNLLDVDNWTVAPTQATVSSHLTFGANTGNGTGVTVNNPQLDYNPLSITFAADTNKPYTFTGNRIVLGRWPGPTDDYVSGTTLLNASGQAHTFNSDLYLASVQTWDSGSAPGGSLTFNGQSLVVDTNSGLRITGANTITINSALADISSGANDGITKFGTGTLVLTGNSGAAAVNFVVHQGTLRVNNTAGSGTGAGSVMVHAGGRLEGIGTIAPAAGQRVTINPGGIIRGGFDSTVGTLTVNGDVRLVGALGSGTQSEPGGGTLEVGLNSSATQASLLSITGIGTLTFDVTNGPIQIRLDNDSGLMLGVPYTFRIASSAGGFRRVQGTITTDPGEYLVGTDFVLSSANFASFSNIHLLRNGTDLNLQFTPMTPVPESRLVLIVAVVGLFSVRMLRWHRRVTKASHTAYRPSELAHPSDAVFLNDHCAHSP